MEDKGRNMSDKVTLKIPRQLYNRLQEIIAESGFNSVTEFVVYVMRDLATAEGMEDRDRDTLDLTREEVEAIKKKLKKFGYL